MNTIKQSGVELSVTVNGKAVRVYQHDGRYYIESREGTEYALEIKNNNRYRVEVVAAIDGLNVINGKRASSKDSGYLVNAWSSTILKGFRKDESEVGAFKFTRKEKSYAEAKGQGDNVGVIAVAVYAEKEKPKPVEKIVEKHIHHDHYIDNTDYYPWWPYRKWKPYTPYWYGGDVWCSTTLGYSGDPIGSGGSGGNSSISNFNGLNSVNFCSTDMGAGGNYSLTANCATQGDEGTKASSDFFREAKSSRKLSSKSVQSRAGGQSVTASCAAPEDTSDHGTSWGTKLQDKIRYVEFERGAQTTVFEIYYNSKVNLEALGVQFIQEKQISKAKGFPADFATPPADWVG